VRQIARLVLLGGAVALGLYLFRASPRDVTLVYDFGRAPPRALEVEIAKDGRTVRQAELRSSGDSGQVVHRVRLADGEYTVRLSWDGSGAEPGVSGAEPPMSKTAKPAARIAPKAQPPGRSLERRVTVEESGTVVLTVDARDQP